MEKIYCQSLPGAHVAGNLYRTAKVSGKLPAVLYLCGHTKGKVSAPYQVNPRWFAEHGYVALVLDPVQLGEYQGMHHGTYRAERRDCPTVATRPLAPKCAVLGAVYWEASLLPVCADGKVTR